MSTFKTVMRRILNLPEPRSDAAKVKAKGKKGEASLPGSPPAGQPSPAPQAPAGLQQWTDAAARLQGQTPSSQPAPGAATGAGAGTGAVATEGRDLPWQLEDENSGTKFLVKAGRGALWAVVGLAAITGIRSWFWAPEPPKAPVQVSSGPTYPVQEAQAVAARFARSYLSWDESDPKARAEALARDMAKGIDTAAGWNQKGHQEVLAAQPGAVTEEKDKRARVRVDVLVKASGTDGSPKTVDKPKDDKSKDKKDDPKKDDKAAKDDKGDGRDSRSADGPRWVGLEIPVVQTSGRILVSGQPGMVGVPTDGTSAPALNTKSTDLDFSEKTRGVAEEFFTKYATGEAESVAAPGASVAPLPPGVNLGGLRNWSVDEGSGTDRIGTATVTWLTGGAELEETYRVKLTRVASAKAERWQVSEVHGGMSS
ncbi:conjugal transfer protein [Streptomyces sp. URMC 124]|uniref:conjugal transfer protein n=1 Tax=Streptomyces sp. URMC 124 TaxID=3423405 RepID=UPI003F1DA90C